MGGVWASAPGKVDVELELELKLALCQTDLYSREVLSRRATESPYDRKGNKLRGSKTKLHKLVATEDGVLTGSVAGKRRPSVVMWGAPLEAEGMEGHGRQGIL
uniref:Uncharacterized protein n=1 Tax=Oryza glumipatula TaxID=40148 RepID=A0A0D9YUA2_9ORYZ